MIVSSYLLMLSYPGSAGRGGMSEGAEVVVLPPVLHPDLPHGRLRGVRHAGAQVHLLSRGECLDSIVISAEW